MQTLPVPMSERNDGSGIHQAPGSPFRRTDQDKLDNQDAAKAVAR